MPDDEQKSSLPFSARPKTIEVCLAHSVSCFLSNSAMYVYLQLIRTNLRKIHGDSKMQWYNIQSFRTTSYEHQLYLTGCTVVCKFDGCKRERTLELSLPARSCESAKLHYHYPHSRSTDDGSAASSSMSESSPPASTDLDASDLATPAHQEEKHQTNSGIVQFVLGSDRLYCVKSTPTTVSFMFRNIMHPF